MFGRRSLLPPPPDSKRKLAGPSSESNHNESACKRPKFTNGEVIVIDDDEEEKDEGPVNSDGAWIAQQYAARKKPMSLHRVREEVFEEGRFARSQPMSGNNLYYTDTARQSMHQANSPGAVRDAKAAPSVPGSWPAEQAPLSGRAPYGVAQPVSQVVTMIGPQRPKNLFGPQSTANGDQKLTKINDSNPFA